MSAPDISLPRFEGPLDLLLALVRKNEVEIADLPIALITRQYLQYLHQAGELNIDLGAEFIYMAALLIHIKSRCLLPADPEIGRREPDPREELVRQLLDHDQVRQGAEFLQQKLEVAGATWSKSSMAEFRQPSEPEAVESEGRLNLLQVLKVAQEALAAARTYDLVAPRDPVEVASMIQWLEERLRRSPGVLEADLLLEEQPDAPHRMALFLGMLEMAKSAQISLEQERCFGPIFLANLSGPSSNGTTAP